MSENILANPDATYVEGIVGAALKPGALVTYGTSGDTAGEFVATAANAGDDKLLMVLDMDPMTGGGLDTSYTANDTGRAERLVAGKTYNVRSTAAAYTVGQAVQAGAGVVSAHSGTNRAVGYVAKAKTTTSSDPFLTIYAA